MKTTKKMLCALLTMVMLLSLFSGTAFAEEKFLATPNINSAKVVKNGDKYYCEVGTPLSEAIDVKDNGNSVELSSCTVTVDSYTKTTIQEGEKTYYVALNDSNKSDQLTITGVDSITLNSITVDTSETTAQYGTLTRELVLKITANYTISDVAQTVDKKIASGFTVSPETVDQIGAKDYTVSYGGKEAAVSITGTAIPVSSVALTVDTPVAGTTLGSAALKEDAVGVNEPSIAWSRGDEAVSGKAGAATVYTATVTLTAAQNYSLSGTKSVTVNDESATSSSYNEDNGVLTVTYKFSQTGDDARPTISGITQPEIKVAYGTTAEAVKASLPTSVTVTSCTDTSVNSVPVTGWSCDYYDANTAGTYTFTGTVAEGYKLAEGVAITAKVEVGAKTVSAAAPDVNVTYGTTGKLTVNVSEPTSGYTIYYKQHGSDDSEYTTTSPEYTVPGEYQVDYKVVSTDTSYAAATGTGKVIVGKGSITITVNNATKAFGASDPAFGYTISSGKLVYNDTLSLSLSRADGETVGSYSINASNIVIKDKNSKEITDYYDVNVKPGTFTVTSNPGVYIKTGTTTDGYTVYMNGEGDTVQQKENADGTISYASKGDAAKMKSSYQTATYTGSSYVTFKSPANYNGDPSTVTVYCNGKKLEYNTDFGIKQGSTIVWLSTSYLNSLTNNSNYEVNIITQGQQTEGIVYINRATTVSSSTSTSTPKTGDTSNLTLWLSLLLVSAAIIVIVVVVVIKKKKKNGEQ